MPPPPTPPAGGQAMVAATVLCPLDSRELPVEGYRDIRDFMAPSASTARLPSAADAGPEMAAPDTPTAAAQARSSSSNCAPTSAQAPAVVAVGIGSQMGGSGARYAHRWGRPDPPIDSNKCVAAPTSAADERAPPVASILQKLREAVSTPALPTVDRTSDPIVKRAARMLAACMQEFATAHVGPLVITLAEKREEAAYWLWLAPTLLLRRPPMEDDGNVTAAKDSEVAANFALQKIIAKRLKQAEQGEWVNLLDDYLNELRRDATGGSSTRQSRAAPTDDASRRRARTI